MFYDGKEKQKELEPEWQQKAKEIIDRVAKEGEGWGRESTATG